MAAQDNHATITGNVGGDPELRYTPQGVAVASFGVAFTPRVKQGNDWVDGDPTWFNVSAWRGLGENVAEGVRKGDRVTVTGTVQLRKYQRQDGGEGQSLDLNADDVALSLKFRNPRTGQSASSGNSGGASQGAPRQETPPPPDVPF